MAGSKLMLVLGVLALAACSSDAEGGSGEGGTASPAGGGSEEADIPCTDDVGCVDVAHECPCEGGPQQFAVGCEDTDEDGFRDTCMARETVCANVGCPLGGPTGSGAGGAPSTGTGDTSGAGAGESTSSGDDTSSGSGDDTSSGSGTPMHPECEAYADGQCACGFNGQCGDGQREELVDYCNGFFDTAYMQCQIGCATSGGTCTEKSECSYACE